MHFTNKQRFRFGLSRLEQSSSLADVARKHSSEMARKGYFSHKSPVRENRTLEDRLNRSGIPLVNTTFGENIGVDYFLKISNIPFYIRRVRGFMVYMNAKTNEPIPMQSYEEFAFRMIGNLMNSKHHRENILNKTYTKIGIGVADGKYQRMDAIFITQNFQGMITHNDL